jgi:2-polyprenyl-6-hydroxyphenyl methylase/3-demethylubiquinone-9 3-methyltransferase
MALHVDPEGNEVRALERVADWRRKRVIEIGCGGGRLTLRLAALGASVHALDPDPNAVRLARRALPGRYTSRVRYRVGDATQLKVPDESFDIAIFAWSL